MLGFDESCCRLTRLCWACCLRLRARATHASGTLPSPLASLSAETSTSEGLRPLLLPRSMVGYRRWAHHVAQTTALPRTCPLRYNRQRWLHSRSSSSSVLRRHRPPSGHHRRRSLGRRRPPPPVGTLWRNRRHPLTGTNPKGLLRRPTTAAPALAFGRGPIPALRPPRTGAVVRARTAAASVEATSTIPTCSRLLHQVGGGTRGRSAAHQAPALHHRRPRRLRLRPCSTDPAAVTARTTRCAGAWRWDFRPAVRARCWPPSAGMS